LRKRLNETGKSSLGDRVFSAKALWQITGKTNEALPVLINALEKDNSFWAADILGMMGAAAKPAIPTLRGALQSPEGYTRLRSAIALHKITPEFEVPLPLLLDLLKVENTTTRFEAAQAIWSLNHDSQMILPTLLELLKPNNRGPIQLRRMDFNYIGPAVMRFLGEIGPSARAAVPRLKEIVQEHDSPNSSKLAAEALKKIEGDSSDKRVQP
jgi:HEAT repeat protein